MTKLYRVKETACEDGGYACFMVEIHGWLWLFVVGETYRSIATGGKAGWFDHELEELDVGAD